MAFAFLTAALNRRHRTKEFQCERPELAEYLRRYALRATERGGAKTFVSTAEDDANFILGYYSIVPSEITAAEAPPALIQGLGRYPLPGFRLARLAVHGDFGGRGLGPKLLLDAGLRALAAAQLAGGKVLFIDAKDEKAASFYRHFGAVPLPDHPLRLIWPLEMIEVALGARGKQR